VRATVKDPAKPFTLVVVLKLKDGSGPQFEAWFAKVAKESRKEKGNRAYDLSRSVKEPAQYLVYERWDNLAALEAHLKSPHFQEAAAALTGVVAGPPEIRILVPVGD
jgi:quinol monooxygenase YgiN